MKEREWEEGHIIFGVSGKEGLEILITCLNARKCLEITDISIQRLELQLLPRKDLPIQTNKGNIIAYPVIELLVG